MGSSAAVNLPGSRVRTIFTPSWTRRSNATRSTAAKRGSSSFWMKKASSPDSSLTNGEREAGGNMRYVKLLIGGQSVCAHGGATFDRIDPFTGEIASRAAAAAVEDADAAVTAAQAAFPSWSALGPTERRLRLN